MKDIYNIYEGLLAGQDDIMQSGDNYAKEIEEFINSIETHIKQPKLWNQETRNYDKLHSFEFIVPSIPNSIIDELRIAKTASDEYRKQLKLEVRVLYDPCEPNKAKCFVEIVHYSPNRKFSGIITMIRSEKIDVNYDSKDPSKDNKQELIKILLKPAINKVFKSIFKSTQSFIDYINYKS